MILFFSLATLVIAFVFLYVLGAREDPAAVAATVAFVVIMSVAIYFASRSTTP